MHRSWLVLLFLLFGILTLSPGAARAGEPWYLMLCGNQDALVLGTVRDVGNGLIRLDVSQVIGGRRMVAASRRLRRGRLLRYEKLLWRHQETGREEQIYPRPGRGVAAAVLPALDGTEDVPLGDGTVERWLPVGLGILTLALAMAIGWWRRRRGVS